MEKIKVLIVKPAYDPYVKEIDNTLQTKQKIVGGLIEFVELDNNTDLICNEEGKLLNLEMNKIITNDVICGTFIIAGQENGDTISLTDKQIKYYIQYFNTKLHTIPITLLKKKYPNSSDLLNYNLRGIEKLLDIEQLNKFLK